MAFVEKWQKHHRSVIDDFLREVNARTDEYVLKGGTALMKCYRLDRFSEDIDFDGTTGAIFDIADNFCKKRNYEYRIAKDTDAVKRCMIHYNGEKPLKIEVSCRRKEIGEDETVLMNGIRVYKIDRLASMKASAYMSRDRIRDLYDVSFICNHYFDELSEQVKNTLRDAIENKGLEQFDYLVANQKDELIDESALASSFLSAIEKLGILIQPEEAESIELAIDRTEGQSLK